MRFLKRPIFFYRGYNQALFFLTLIIYVWFFPPSDTFEGLWMDTFIDHLGIVSLICGAFLRVWAVSHVGRCTRSRRLKATVLVTTGPYAYVRHPIYVGNFFIGLGMIILSEALVFMPAFLLLFTFQYRAIISTEDEFLKRKFGEEFDRYCLSVPRYIPRSLPARLDFSLGRDFPPKELGTVWGIIVGAFFFEWIESPLHRQWLLSFYHWLTGGISL